MAVTQECAAILAIMKDAGHFESKLLGVELDGLVEIPGDHAGMLQISGECGHGFAHDGSPLK